MRGRVGGKFVAASENFCARAGVGCKLSFSVYSLRERGRQILLTLYYFLKMINSS
jgi:hypothetical protein